MKKIALLLLAPLFIFGCQKVTNVPVSNSPQGQSQADVVETQPSTLELLNSGKNVQFPVGENIVAAERLMSGDGSDVRFLVVTTSEQNIKTDNGSIHAPVKIWIVHGTEMKLLNVHNFREEETGFNENEKVDLRWDKTIDGFIDVQFQVEIGGLGEEIETLHNYIDIVNEKALATSSWITESPTFVLEIGKQKYTIGLAVKNGCEKEWTDSSTGLLMNTLEMKFSKEHHLACATPPTPDGVDETYKPSPTMPELGAPSFHDGNFVSFNLPWGTPVDIDLEKQTVHSKDFAHDYALPVETSTARKNS